MDMQEKGGKAAKGNCLLTKTFSLIPVHMIKATENIFRLYSLTIRKLEGGGNYHILFYIHDECPELRFINNVAL